MKVILPSRAARLSAIPLVALSIGAGVPMTAAHAVTVSPNPVVCNTAGAFTIDAVQGETFTLQFSSCVTVRYDTRILSANQGSGTATVGDSITFTVLPHAPVGLHAAAVTLTTVGDVVGSLTIEPAPEQAPTPWFQSYARHAAAEQCATTWHPSWAQWPNNHTGGPTCDRTYVYDVAQGLWQYQ